MSNFLSKDEIKISEEFEKNGFVIADVENHGILKDIRQLFTKSLKKKLNTIL